jgi:hypothetical protein
LFVYATSTQAASAPLEFDGNSVSDRAWVNLGGIRPCAGRNESGLRPEAAGRTVETTDIVQIKPGPGVLLDDD